MGEILSYSLSVSLIVMVLFPVMHLIVNHSTYFRFNRIVILGGFMLAFVFNSGIDTFDAPIMEYTYRDGNDKRCSAADVEKTLVRYFKSPVGFMISEIGGESGKVHIVGKDGKVMNNADASQISVPYKPLEIK